MRACSGRRPLGLKGDAETRESTSADSPPKEIRVCFVGCSPAVISSLLSVSAREVEVHQISSTRREGALACPKGTARCSLLGTSLERLIPRGVLPPLGPGAVRAVPGDRRGGAREHLGAAERVPAGRCHHAGVPRVRR